MPVLGITACGDDDSADVDPSGGGGGGDGEEEGICLLNNCSDDKHCVGCQDNRDTCLIAENRCVACDPNTGEGCEEGQDCSPFGICVPEGLTCPTDGDGTPTVTCNANSDCLACSPMHQVCDTDTGRCQACTATNTQHCLQSDICIDTDDDGREDSCSPKCPATCDDNNDCSLCGGNDPNNQENWAHACYQHKCAECNPDKNFPCPAGEDCVNGTCVKPCGQPGEPVGTCDTAGGNGDTDCAFCGDGDDQWECRTPVNSTRGSCIPPVAGCSDLGGLAVLPEPYSDFTNLCSPSQGNADCANVGIQYDVGKQIQDLVGGPELDLGFTTVTISSPANVEYPMPICAGLEITDGVTCGVCVPCKEDSDCQPIDVDPLIGDLFADEPLAQIAFALLADLLWGSSDDHHLNFFCLDVAGELGACLPCANPLSECGGGGGGGSGMCDHNVCTVGSPLDGDCDDCAELVCDEDSFCCNNTWDQDCIDLADDVCNGICSSGDPCQQHDACTEGVALLASCNQCTADVCAADSFCCNSAWDDVCVAHATDPQDDDYQASCAAICP